MKIKSGILTTLYILVQISFFSNAQTPKINSLNTTRANIYDTLVVTGDNFNTNINSGALYIGTLKSNIIEATATQIKAIVPLGVSSDRVIYQSNSFTAYSPYELSTVFSGNSSISSSNFKKLTKQNTVPNSTVYIEKGDLNNDNKIDFVVSSNKYKGLTVFQNNTNLPYNGSSVSSNSFSNGIKLGLDNYAYAVIIADLNSDGFPEIIATTDNSNKFYIFQNTGKSGNVDSTQFSLPIVFNTPTTNTTEVAVSDLDKDGKPDLILTSSDSSKLLVYKNQLTQNTITNTDFILTNEISFGNCSPLGLLGVTASDLNNDGFEEIITTLQCNNELIILPNNSASSNIIFKQPVRISINYQPICLSSIDLNNDNKKDIIISLEGYGIVCLTNNIQSTIIDSSQFVIRYNPLKLTNPNFVYQLRTADFNGDKKIDLSVSSSNAVVIFQNICETAQIIDSLTLTETTTIPANYPISHAVGDFNLDGRCDLIMAQYIYDFMPTGTLTFATNINGFPIGIKESTVMQTNLIAFPNPAFNHITFDTKSKIKTITAFNLLGKLAYEEKLLHSTESYTINCDNLTNGIYYFVVELINGENLTQKIVVNR
jgi:hypothetical protein